MTRFNTRTLRQVRARPVTTPVAARSPTTTNKADVATNEAVHADTPNRSDASSFSHEAHVRVTRRDPHAAAKAQLSAVHEVARSQGLRLSPQSYLRLQRGAKIAVWLGLDPQDVALAAAEGASQAQRDARLQLATTFYRHHEDWSADRIADHVSGVELKEPVIVDELPGGSSLRMLLAEDWRGDGIGRIGTYATDEVVTAQDKLGIAPGGRQAGSFSLEQPVPVLSSTAAPIVDTWSRPGQQVMCRGGAGQYFIPSIHRALIESGAHKFGSLQIRLAQLTQFSRDAEAGKLPTRPRDRPLAKRQDTQPTSPPPTSSPLAHWVHSHRQLRRQS